MNFACWLQRTATGRVILLAEPDHAPRIAREIAAYEREQDPGVDTPVNLPHFPAQPWMAFLWAVALMIGFVLQSRIGGFTEWGSNNFRALGNGEFWRPLTALFLHGDLEHLAGNIVFGALLGLLACHSIGRSAWPLIFAGGIIGNALTIWIRAPLPISSIGASTAVFSALGLLTGYGLLIAIRLPVAVPWSSVMAPIGGGIALLAWSGAGGPEVDVLAHVVGFAVGAVLGAISGVRQATRLATQISE